MRRPRHLLLGASGIVLVIAGASAAFTLASRPADEAAPEKAPARPVTGYGLTVTPQRGWLRSSDASPVPGTRLSASLVLVEPLSKTRVVAAWAAATSPTLLPQGLLRELTQPPDNPVKLRLGGQLPAYYYRDLSLPGIRGRLDVYAAPTTAGVAVVACLGQPSPLEECADTADTLRVARGQPVRADPGTAFRLHLGPRMDAVDAARERTRRLLQTATTPQEQASATMAVSVAYRDAVRVLAPLAHPSFGGTLGVVGQLRANAAAYARLSADLRAQDDAALARDREAALAGEARLKTLLSEQR